MFHFMATQTLFWLQHNDRAEVEIEQHDTNRGFVILYFYRVLDSFLQTFCDEVLRAFAAGPYRPEPFDVVWFPDLLPEEVE